MAMRRYKYITRALTLLLLTPVAVIFFLLGYVVGETAGTKGFWRECITINDGKYIKKPYKVCL